MQYYDTKNNYGHLHIENVTTMYLVLLREFIQIIKVEEGTRFTKRKKVTR